MRHYRLVAHTKGDLKLQLVWEPKFDLMRQIAAEHELDNAFYSDMIVGLEPLTVLGILWFQTNGSAYHPLEHFELC